MSNSIGIITESLAFLSSPSRSFSRFGRIGTRTIAPSRLSGSIRRRWTRWCSPTTNFRGASFTASIAGFAFSRIPATQAGGTCVVRSVAAGTAAGNALTSGAPRTTARQRADGRRNAATPVASASRSRRPRRRRISRRRISSNRRRRPAPCSAESPLTVELRWGGVVLDESDLATSPMLPYVRMLVGLIEGVEFTCGEVLCLLRQSMRQRRLGARRRIDYILAFLHQHPP